ncbi:MAG: DUF5018 domain-containing protein [Candidatus Pacebacteria bacterium]|nr:DUF5018 domain-containing protein [Candidatus Paceibacterota bacterium]
MNKKLLKRIFTGFMILNVILGQISAITAVSAQDKYSTNKEIISDKTDSEIGNAIVKGPRTKNLAKDSKKANLSEAKKKIGTDLLKLIDEDFLVEGESRTDIVSDMKEMNQYVDKTDTARNRLKKQDTRRDDLVYAYVETKENVGTNAIDTNVWEVTGRDEKHRLAAAYIEIDKLEALAALPEVASIKTVTPPRVRKGTVTTEGDIVHKTAEVRSAYAKQATGVKIGLISDGMANEAAAEASGDIPGSVTLVSNYQDGDEGTAMMEILYDMAPGALLYFHQGGNTMMDFNAAVDELIENGCKIIVDDMGWDEEAFFENGVIGDHIASIMATQDVVFVSAAGNEADVHYQGTFYDDDEYPGYNDFSRGTSSYTCLYVNLPAGEDLDILLQWNDRFGASNNDFDLEIYNANNGEFLQESANTQNGNDNPTEAIYYTNNTDRSINVEVNVYNYDASSSSILELYLWPSDGTVSSKNIVAADSIWGHPNVKGVMAVGAIGANDSGYDTIEYYSSRGPSTIIGEAQRAKPDIIALDNVSVSDAGGFGSTFPGTSASAPAVGAIVAQLWGAFPTLKGTAIRDAILNSAVDLGASGYDYTYGYGRADALRAYQSLDTTVTKSSNKAITAFTLAGQTGAINESNHTVTINLPTGTSVTSLAPTISISAKASVNPTSSTPRNFTGPIVYTVTAEDGSTQAYVVVANVAGELSHNKAITAFTLAGQTGIINESNHTVTVNLPAGSNITSIAPTISISAGASISPAASTPKSFTNPVTYTVTAEDGSAQPYMVIVNVGQSSNDITGPTITLTGSSSIDVVLGENYNEQGATATDDVDGSVNVITSGSVNTGTIGVYIIQYTAIDAAGNVTTATRTVRVISAGSDQAENNITSFRFASLGVNGIIDQNNHEIRLTVTFSTNVTSLVPTITTDAGASVSPNSGVAQNFSVPKTYTVTSADGLEQTYIVSVKIDDSDPVAIPAGIVDGDIIQCRTSSDPNAVYVVKIVGNKSYIRHIVSLQIFNYYKHLKWENLKLVGSLESFSLSGWVRVNTGPNGTPGANDKVWEINGNQTRHWINMTAQQFLTHGGSDEAIYTINQGELNLYAIGADVMSL